MGNNNISQGGQNGMGIRGLRFLETRETPVSGWVSDISLKGSKMVRKCQ